VALAIVVFCQEGLPVGAKDRQLRIRSVAQHAGLHEVGDACLSREAGPILVLRVVEGMVLHAAVGGGKRGLARRIVRLPAIGHAGGERRGR
jgi:hypothetical protein